MPKRRFRYHARRRLAGRPAEHTPRVIQRRVNRALRFLSLPGPPTQADRIYLLVDDQE